MSSGAAGPREFPTDGDVSAGRYTLSQFPARISFEIPAFEPPAEWFVCGPFPGEQAVCHRSEPDTGVVAVTFQIVDNVVTDPCQDQEAAELLEVFEQTVERHGGAIFETVGDAVYAAFSDAGAATAAAVDAQLALGAADWGPIGRLAVRIAVHTGAVERRGDHYFGSALFRVACSQFSAAPSAAGTRRPTRCS